MIEKQQKSKKSNQLNQQIHLIKFNIIALQNQRKQQFVLLMKSDHSKKIVIGSQQQSNPLPILQKKKTYSQSYSNERTVKNRKNNKKQLSEDRITKKYEDIYSYIQEIYKIQDKKRKIIISPTRGILPENLAQICQPLKKQLERLRNKITSVRCQQDEWSPFSAAMRQMPVVRQQIPKYKPSSHQNNKSPKKSIRERLKPISQAILCKQAQQFLSIEKMNIKIAAHEANQNLKKSNTIDYHTQKGVSYKRGRNYEPLNNTARKRFYHSKAESRQFHSTIDERSDSKLDNSQLVFIQNIGQPKDESQQQSVDKVLQKLKKQKQQKKSKFTYLKTIRMIAICDKQEYKNEQIQKQEAASFKIKYKEFSKENIRISPVKENKEKETGFSVLKRRKQFVPPFETYYYRNLIWKVNYTNGMMVETPNQYEHRLKVFIGKGNNSALVRGFIKRRIWFATTDRIQDANFVWTQLKNLSYLKSQPMLKEKIVKVCQQDKYLDTGFLTQQDTALFKKYMDIFMSSQQRCDQRLLARNKFFKIQNIIKSSEIKETKVHNHLINNYVIGNKKALFQTMLAYYSQTKQQIFDYVPITFHVINGLEDQNYLKFLKLYYKRAKDIKANNPKKNKHNAWIVKPGENSNRGRGIQMCLTLQQIRNIVKKKEKYADGSPKTFIVQSYIEHPLLYKKRKFDIRHYIMITSVNGHIKGYWYQDGYVRTTSTQYSLKNSTSKVHLTNDAVQKMLPDYGKYEKGNKLSYSQLQQYLQKNHKIDFKKYIYPKMRKIATDTMKACSGTIDPDKRGNNFEIFGLDFMLDSQYNVWLIEVNSNPCLEISCPILGSIIPRMIQNALQLTLDTVFPPPVRFSPKGMYYFKNLEQQNRFQLVYDQRIEKLYKCSMDVIDAKLLEQEDDVFEDDGDEWDQDD